MAEITKNKHSHSDLPGRVESPAIEIYASTGMPKDNVMPTYTHTQTFGHTISFALTTGEKLMDLPPAELYKLPPESWSAYFYEVQEANNTMVDNQYTELRRWELYTRLMEGHNPNPSQYDKKIDKLYMELPSIELKDESGKPALDRLFPNGVHDTTFCGLYLIINGCTEVAIKTLSGIQWLMRKRDALQVRQKAQTSEEKTQAMAQQKTVSDNNDDNDNEPDILHTLLTEKLKLPTNGDDSDINIGGATYKQGQILVMTQVYYKKQNKAWAKSRAMFCKKVASILNVTTKSLEMKISRATEKVRGVPLDNITQAEIMKKTKCSSNQAEEEYNKWNGLPELISKLAEACETPLRNV